MRILREKSLATKLLLLLEILLKKPSKLTFLADAVGITPQAVSEYIKRLTKEGFVVQNDGRYQVTKEGVAFVHSHFLELKRFTEERIKYLDIIDRCIAVAGGDIQKGERVGLFMKKGHLVAFPNKKSSSTGVALRDARHGEDVPVGELEGIAEHYLGNLYIIPISYSIEMGSRDIPLDKVRDAFDEMRCDKVAVGDTVARSIVKSLGKNVDFEFAPIEASLEAVKKGLSVCFLGPTRQVERLISRVNKFNSSSPDKIIYRFIDI
ncbi:MAG TPA: winged helix-turn-helix transcriptional regulator [Thermoplasmata archaeon]|nr:winged helix-turn-helix transcriptional regulator [Thermoplasmata archaeon]